MHHQTKCSCPFCLPHVCLAQSHNSALDSRVSIQASYHHLSEGARRGTFNCFLNNQNNAFLCREDEIYHLSIIANWWCQGTVLVQGQRIPSKCLSMTDSGEAGRLWLCPLNSHTLCSRTSNQVPRDMISWRGDTGALRTLHLSQDLSSPAHVPSRVQCGKEKADFHCLQGYRPQPWGRPGEQAVIWAGGCRGSHHQATAREGMAFLHEASTCGGSALEQAASISGPVSS